MKKFKLAISIIALILTVVLFNLCVVTAGTSTSSPTETVTSSATPKPTVTGSVTNDYNFAKALQYSIYFYDAEKCGSGITGGKLEWRGDCHLQDKAIPLKAGSGTVSGTSTATGTGTGTVYKKGDTTNLTSSFVSKYKNILDPDGDGYMDLTGGFHDAGDHVKFGLPQGYAASTLEWGFYEFRDTYKSTGQEEHMIDILKWFTDYFMKCTFTDSSGNIIAFCYQVGDGDMDHSYWGPPELQTEYRPAFFATSETPASDQCAEAAAALTISYLNFKDTDLTYANKCLTTAKKLYAFSVKYQGLGYSGGYYGSAYFEDELAWAAVWLNIATGEKSYINDIISEDASGNYTGYLKKIIKDTNNDWQNIWVHSWDVVWGGVFAKLAPITNTERDWYIFRWNLEYWSGVPHKNPNDKTFMAATPGGFRVVNTWGSARYNTAEQLCALVYRKQTGETVFTDWAKNQMEYIMGNNPMKRNYIVGYADNSAKHPHHRAAHGSDTNNMGVPENHRHTLWGALVGGPDQKDNHNDITTDYVSNEVAIDYNAAFVGACAGLTKYYGDGQKPVTNFPPKEKEESYYYTKSRIEQENKERTQVVIGAFNKSVHPPRIESTFKARYFFDISEMISKGQTIADMKFECYYDEADSMTKTPAKLSKPVQWSGNVYYVEIDWTNIPFYGKREYQLALIPSLDSSYKANWDPTNDFSRKDLKKSDTLVDSPYIPLYLNGVKVYGEEPPK